MKRYIIRKYVLANSLREALTNEKKGVIVNVLQDEDYQDEGKSTPPLGFKD